MPPGGIASRSNAMFPWPRRPRPVLLPPNLGCYLVTLASGNLYRVMVKFCRYLPLLWNTNAVYV